MVDVEELKEQAVAVWHTNKRSGITVCGNCTDVFTDGETIMIGINGTILIPVSSIDKTFTREDRTYQAEVLLTDGSGIDFILSE